MKSIYKRTFLFFLTLLILITSTVGRFPAPAKAQCPSAADPNYDADYCTTATDICQSSADGTATAITDALFSSNIDACISFVYALTDILSDTPIPQPWYDPDPREFAKKVFDKTNPDEIFGERYTYAQVRWIINSFITILFPPLAAQDSTDLMNMLLGIIRAVKTITTSLGLQAAVIDELPNYGFIGQTYYLMAKIPDLLFTDRVASGIDEVKYMAGKLNIASPAYAQGLGYDKLGLGTVRSLWVATRNIAYLIAVLILIVAGFMIIFRTKISAQASVTIQMVIPRLLISLFLVTFSYAIAGFVIDMLYVFITAVLGLLYFVQSVVPDTTFFVDGQIGLNTAIGQLTGGFNFVGHFLGWYIVFSVLFILLGLILPILAMTGGGVGVVASAVLVPLLGMLVAFFIWSIYVWARILGQLIISYLTLILLIIAGPIMIIFDILPTSPGGFKKWILCVIGNASVFATYAMLSILIFFLFDNTVGTNTGFYNDPTSTTIRSNFDLPLFTKQYPLGGTYNWLNPIQYFLFIGFMSMVPNIVSTIKNLFCKDIGMDNFIESSVKDTISKFTSAGQEGVGSVKKYREDVARTAHYTNIENLSSKPSSGTKTTGNTEETVSGG